MKRWRTDDLTRRAFVAALAFLFGALGGPDSAQAKSPTPDVRSFSPEGLARVGDYFRNEVATGKIPGAVVLIQQHGKPVFSESFGVRDVTTKVPMTEDTIFRLYSMSKPVTSVAAMMLVDDGRLALDQPLTKYIPAFADVMVAAERHGEGRSSLATEPLKRPITIEDLLRHTSGITYDFYGDSPVRKLYANSDLFKGDFDNATFVERLAKLPLAEQPGTLWDYGHSTDVLGRVAQPLPEDRFIRPVAGLTDPILPQRWESGGAGMIGTIDDYARFAQMLLNGGTLDGKRYLKAQTVARMISDHVGHENGIARDQYDFPGRDSGFGLGFAVRKMVNPPLPAGEYRWDGVGGTFFFIDPADDMFAIVMMQSPSQRGRIQTEAKKLVYQALGR